MSERTTMTLDDDVAGLIADEVRRTGKAKKTVVNDAVRRGLDSGHRREPEPFTVEARPMGRKPGYDLTSISALLEQVEGPERWTGQAVGLEAARARSRRRSTRAG